MIMYNLTSKSRKAQSASKIFGILPFILVSLNIAKPALTNDLSDLLTSEDHVIDMLNVCFSKNLDCRILSRSLEGEKQYVVLVGERHDQDEKALKIGMKLLRHYPIVSQEGGQGFIKKFNRFFGFYPHSLANTYSSFTTNNTKLMDLEKGFSFFERYNKKCYTAFGLIALGGICKNVARNYLSPEISPYLKTLSDITSLYGIYQSMKEVLLNSIIFDPERMRKRDVIMTKNIIAALDSSDARSMAAVMGASHIYGVTKSLLKNGFVDLTFEANNLYSEYIMSHSQELKETKDRDLANPLSSFTGARWYALQTYPEDFTDQPIVDRS